MIDTPRIVETETQQTAVIRLTIPREQMRQAMGPGIRELLGVVAAQGITPTAPWFTHHFKMDPKIFDFEIGVPVPAAIAAVGRVQAGHLPAAKVARAIYHGPYEGLSGAWGELTQWIKAEGLAEAAELWESYVKGPESSPDSADWQTELNRPLID
ncbi:MAG: GyrI-like domain-containing protein [Acidobacteriota bacterium]